MSDPNIVPPMTDPLGRHWEQPNRDEILIDDTHAVMTEATLNKLHNYSASTPSGVYHGKMWRGECDGSWFLRWWGQSDKPDMCSGNQRPILIV